MIMMLIMMVIIDTVMITMEIMIMMDMMFVNARATAVMVMVTDGTIRIYDTDNGYSGGVDSDTDCDISDDDQNPRTTLANDSTNYRGFDTDYVDGQCGNGSHRGTDQQNIPGISQETSSDTGYTQPTNTEYSMPTNRLSPRSNAFMIKSVT